MDNLDKTAEIVAAELCNIIAKAYDAKADEIPNVFRQFIRHNSKFIDLVGTCHFAQLMLDRPEICHYLLNELILDAMD